MEERTPYIGEPAAEAKRKAERVVMLVGALQGIDDRKPGSNKPENLEPMTRAQMHFLRRKPGSKLRLPGEANPIVRCACGCGAKFRRFDKSNRPRKFVAGHNPR